MLTCPKSGRDGRKMPRISIRHFYLVGPHSLKCYNKSPIEAIEMKSRRYDAVITVINILFVSIIIWHFKDTYYLPSISE